MNLWNYIKEHLLKHPGRHLAEEQAALSFEDAAVWAETFSEKLRGIRCCAILCSSEMAAALSLLACFAAGVTAVPLSMRYGDAHCGRILDTISPDAVLTDTDGTITVYRIRDSRYTPPPVHPALIMCTSGTTGRPKGAMLSERNIITNVSDIADYFEMGAGDTILIARPLYHCAVLTGEFLTAIVKGADIRFYSGPFHPADMLQMIREHRITVFGGTPTLLSLMATFCRKNGAGTLRHLSVSGECMSAQVGEKIRAAFPACHIYHVYGLTEACPRVSYLPPAYFGRYPDCVGIPLRSVSVRILNRAGHLCNIGEEGVLYVKGGNVMLGYYREPERTRRVLKNGWLCTGDIACINEAGFLTIRGRRDDMIIRAGMNIYPAEIEGALKQDPRVKEVLAYGFRHPTGTQIGLKIAGDFSSAEEVRRLCMQVLPAYEVPSAITLLDELPKNASGKVIRRKMP